MKCPKCNEDIMSMSVHYCNPKPDTEWSCPRLGLPVSPHDWPEDDKSENGGYECRCIYCNSIFYGHKRRVVCKVCGTKPISEENDKEQEQ